MAKMHGLLKPQGEAAVTNGGGKSTLTTINNGMRNTLTTINNTGRSIMMN